MLIKPLPSSGRCFSYHATISDLWFPKWQEFRQLPSAFCPVQVALPFLTMETGGSSQSVCNHLQDHISIQKVETLCPFKMLVATCQTAASQSMAQGVTITDSYWGDSWDTNNPHRYFVIFLSPFRQMPVQHLEIRPQLLLPSCYS
jgi:hypothetical protein